jgi:DNA processing protein
MNKDAIDRIRLARTDHVGPVLYRRLMRRYGSAAAALAALPAHAASAGRALRTPTMAEIEAEREQLAARGGHFLILDLPGYPTGLAETEDAPPVLSLCGSAAALARPLIAIVGGRNASANGMRIALQLAHVLASEGYTVVSGMARGIDTAAHRGALKTGATIAAVAGGIDVTYPTENIALQQEIEAKGAVLAEAPWGTAPQARHFPRRNRIIAGLALGVIVIEAAASSGSLITARLALEAGRELFAVPGSPLDPRCRGSNDLLRNGAHLTETAADVLANLPPRRPRVFQLKERPLPIIAEYPSPAPTNAREQLIELLTTSPVAVDDLHRHCQFPPAALHTALIELDLAGCIEHLPGNRVALLDRPA